MDPRLSQSQTSLELTRLHEESRLYRHAYASTNTALASANDRIEQLESELHPLNAYYTDLQLHAANLDRNLLLSVYEKDGRRKYAQALSSVLNTQNFKLAIAKSNLTRANASLATANFNLTTANTKLDIVTSKWRQFIRLLPPSLTLPALRRDLTWLFGPTSDSSADDIAGSRASDAQEGGSGGQTFPDATVLPPQQRKSDGAHSSLSSSTLSPDGVRAKRAAPSDLSRERGYKRRHVAKEPRAVARRDTYLPLYSSGGRSRRYGKGRAQWSEGIDGLRG